MASYMEFDFDRTKGDGSERYKDFGPERKFISQIANQDLSDLDQFIKWLKQLPNVGEETSNVLGLICIQEYIVDQLRGYLVELINAYDNNTNKEVTSNTYERLKTKIRGRIEYFASDEFIKQLKGGIPSNTQINSKDGYTKFLQNIFNIN